MNSLSHDSGEAARSIWVFTPSRTDPRDLEAILVQRHDLLTDAVERVRESALTDHKHHQLFVGPRGCGKTHLVTLIVSRISADAESSQHLRLAWLNEDETCTSLLELLIKIYSALGKRYPGEFREDNLAAAYGLKPTAARDHMASKLLSALGSRTLVIVTENLDALFESMREQGQKELRAFIQEHAQFAIVATAQRLVEDLSDRASPFFGFFQTEHLKTLSVEQATDLLQNIARIQGKPEVIKFLATSRGRSRVRALHHLSGGNHRIYIVLSQFITRESMDVLIGPFLKMVDELTPYYQERVRWLPPMQRKIVEMLCSCEGTVPVKEIARRMFSTSQTISSQLHDLREKGYVESNQRGRESLYEISEPLMRICVEVKENQNTQPLRLLVDFLRVWYDDGELKRRLGLCQPESPSYHYLESALERNSSEGNLRMKMLLEEVWGPEVNGLNAENLKMIESNIPEDLLLAMQCQKRGDVAGALQCVGDALTHVEPPSAIADLLVLQGLLHAEQGDSVGAIADYTRVIEMPGALTRQVARALSNRGFRRSQQDDRVGAIDDFTRVIEMPDAPPTLVAGALLNRGFLHCHQGESVASIADHTRLIKLPDASPDQVGMAFNNRGVMSGQQGDIEAAIADLTCAIQLPGASPEHVAKALNNRGLSHEQKGDHQAEIADYTHVIEMPEAPAEQIARALHNRAVGYGQQGDTEAAIADLSRIIGQPGILSDQVVIALNIRGLMHSLRDDVGAAITDLTCVIEFPNAPPDQVAMALHNRGITFGKQDDRAAEIADYTRVIELPGASPTQVAMALYNRAVAYGQQGYSAAEIADYTRVIDLPGALPKQIVNAHLTLAELHISEGRWSEGFAAMESGLALAAQQSPPCFAAPVEFIGILFAAGLNEEGRRGHAAAIYSLYSKHATIALLGEALVRHLGEVFNTRGRRPSSDNLDQWFTAWQQAAGDVSEFKLPLRLLRTGIDFVKSGGEDQDILLDLTSTERSILRQALDLPL